MTNRADDGLECALKALRRKLVAADPSLPNEYDGAAWWPIEQEFMDAPMVNVTTLGDAGKQFVPGGEA